MERAARFLQTMLRRNIRLFSALFAVYTTGILALIQADYYYKDDLRRTLNGNMWWDRQSRYLSNVISGLLNMDLHIGNLSPLTQLIGAAIMAAGAVMLIRLLGSGKKAGVLTCFAMVPFALSPYFLECFSFQFDIPFMAVSVVSSIAPFLVLKDRETGAPGTIPWFGAASFAGVLVMLLTYQASSGIYPMLAAFLLLKRWNENRGTSRERLRFVIASAGSYLAALLFYMLVLLHPYKNYRSIEMLSLGELIPGAARNYLRFYRHVYYDFKRLWLVLFLAAALLFLAVTVYKSRQKRWQSFLMTGVVLAFCSAMSYGIYLGMKEPAYNPRMMYGFGVLLSIVFLELTAPILPTRETDPERIRCREQSARGGKGRRDGLERGLSLLGKMVCILLGWCFFSFSFLYGNALSEQKRFQEMNMNRVIAALDTVDLMKTDTVKRVQLEGTFGTSPAVQDMEEGYSMLKRLIPNPKATYQWTKYYFFGYLGLANVKPAKTSDDYAKLELPVLADTAYCSIAGEDDRILITIKEQKIQDLM